MDKEYLKLLCAYPLTNRCEAHQIRLVKGDYGIFLILQNSFGSCETLFYLYDSFQNIWVDTHIQTESFI